MKKFLPLILLTITLSWSITSQGGPIKLYNDLAIAKEKVFLTTRENYNSMQMVLSVLIGCQLDELCTLMTMHHLSQVQDNLLYIHYYNILNQRRDMILYKTEHCKAPELKKTRIVLASCLSTLKKPLSEATRPEDVLKVNAALQKCSMIRMASLAKEENIFAYGKLLDYEMKRQNMKGINYWGNKIEALRSTPQYQIYKQCF